MTKEKNRIRGTRKEVNVAISDFNESGPVIIFFRKKLLPSQFSKVLISYIII